MSEMHSDRTIRFLCDQNLGRLAKWLRVLGFDTELMKYWDPDRLEQAVLDGRVVLTRKSTVKACTGILFIPHDHFAEQMHFVKESFGLDKSFRSFSRCIICNEPLNSVSREQVKGLVPEYVYSSQEKFSACPVCRRIYWKGTHAEKAQALMDRLLEKE
jgi:uncharacterized protein